MVSIKEKDYYTTTELAKVLGISRISVFKRVRQGSIKGQKIGRDFVIFMICSTAFATTSGGSLKSGSRTFANSILDAFVSS